MGSIWVPTWVPLGGLRGPIWVLFLSIVFATVFGSLRGPFQSPFRPRKWTPKGTQRDPEGAQSAKCRFVRNMQKPMGFCNFSPFRPFRDDFETGFLEASAPKCIPRRIKAPLEPDFGPNLAPQMGPKWLPKRSKFICNFIIPT